MKEVLLISSRTHRSEKGFTLLESLVAIVILAFGLMAVVTMMDVSFSATNLSKSTTKATHLASWMMDRIKQDTSLRTQAYSTDITRLRSFDNDASGTIAVDTSVAMDPATEPGRSAVQQWRTLLQGGAVAGYIEANRLPGDRLPEAQGRVFITPYKTEHAGNHQVVVQVTWTGILTRGVRLETVLVTAE